MAKVVKNGKVTCWVDHNGNQVPKEHIGKEVIVREKMITKAFGKVQKLETQIKKVKKDMVELIGEYLDKVANSYDKEWKGNATLRSFDQSLKIEINISETIKFDERLQLVKQLLNEFADKQSETGDTTMATIVKKIFKLNKEGSVNSKLLLGLRELKFKDPLWKEAMEIISESFMVVGSKSYYKFFIRDEFGKEQAVELNFSHI